MNKSQNWAAVFYIMDDPLSSSRICYKVQSFNESEKSGTLFNSRPPNKRLGIEDRLLLLAIQYDQQRKQTAITTLRPQSFSQSPADVPNDLHRVGPFLENKTERPFREYEISESDFDIFSNDSSKSISPVAPFEGCSPSGTSSNGTSGKDEVSKILRRSKCSADRELNSKLKVEQVNNSSLDIPNAGVISQPKRSVPNFRLLGITGTTDKQSSSRSSTNNSQQNSFPVSLRVYDISRGQ